MIRGSTESEGFLDLVVDILILRRRDCGAGRVVWQIWRSRDVDGCY